jgi:hypothetical protein
MNVWKKTSFQNHKNITKFRRIDRKHVDKRDQRKNEPANTENQKAQPKGQEENIGENEEKGREQEYRLREPVKESSGQKRSSQKKMI